MNSAMNCLLLMTSHPCDNVIGKELLIFLKQFYTLFFLAHISSLLIKYIIIIHNYQFYTNSLINNSKSNTVHDSPIYGNNAEPVIYPTVNTHCRYNSLPVHINLHMYSKQ